MARRLRRGFAAWMSPRKETNMKLEMLGILGVVAAMGACGGSSGSKSNGGGVATVSGRLEASSDTQAATTASIYSVGDDGQLTLLGSGAIGANGRFTISDLAAAEGPFIVHVDGG